MKLSTSKLSTLKFSYLCLFLASLLFTNSALAMRCGTKLVSKGDSMFKVYKLCGTADFVQERTIYRYGIPISRFTSVDNRLGDRELLLHQRSRVEVLVEDWTYNFGPNQFVRRVRFEDGVVIRIDTQSYGYLD